MASSQKRKPKKSLTFQIAHCEPGDRTEKSSSYNQPAITITTSKTSVKPQTKTKSIICTAESQPKVNNKTLTTKSNTSKTTTQTTLSSQTLVPDLTSKGKDLKPFWNKHVKEMSEKLWFPSKTGCVGLGSILSSGSLKEMVGQSWFSIKKKLPLKKNSQKICSPSLQCFQQGSTVSETTKLRSRKTQIFPNQEQKLILKQWFGLFRWFYNRTIDLTKETNTFSNKLRDLMRQKYQYEKFNFPDWYSGPKKVPSRIIDGAIKRVCDAYTVGFKQLKLGLIQRFELHYKTKKDRHQSINITKDLYNSTSNSFSKIYLGEMKTQSSIKHIEHDTVLTYDNVLDKYFLVVPRSVFSRNEKQVVEGTISMDPGKRCFLTGYSPEGHILEIANHKSQKLSYHFKNIDRLNSSISTTKNKKKKMIYRKAKRRCYKRVENLVNDLHWKTIKYLTENYSTINIGDLSTKDVSQTNLNKGVKRVLQMFSFFKFKQRLKFVCEAKGLSYKCVNEACTSKTCTVCGKIQAKRKDKEFKCLSCGFETDRDWNGARNIHLRASSICSK